jgi:Flp pilus assembly protein TadG
VKHTRRGICSRDGGQSTVEFALVLPLVLALALAVVQLAVVARDQVLVVHAARQAARTASVDPVPDHAVAAARRVAGDVTVHLAPRPGAGEEQVVTVERRVPVRIALLAPFFPDVVVSGRAVMRVER